LENIMLNARGMKAKNWEGHCLMCGKKFNFQSGFECEAQPGRHVVDEREYYHLGAGHIQSLRDRRQFTVALNLVPDLEVRDKVTGQITRVEGLIVHFQPGGKYQTSDPLEQYHLDLHPGVMTGAEGREAWDKMYLTQDQQLQKAQNKLADVQKQIRDNNALLELTKAQKKENVPAVR
jgi:hypothetical protein